MCQGFVGADLASLSREATLLAIQKKNLMFNFFFFFDFFLIPTINK